MKKMNIVKGKKRNISDSESDSSNSIDDLNQSMTELSTDIEPESNSKKRTKSTKPIDNISLFHNRENIENIFDLDMLKSNLPKWGGNLINENGLKIKLINTCTIDNFLLGFWVCSKLNSNLVSNINASDIPFKCHINSIIEQIDKTNWNEAKSFWILKILGVKPKCSCMCSDSECEEKDCKPICDCEFDSQCDMKLNRELSTFGSEYEFFLEPSAQTQRYKIISICSPDCDLNNRIKYSVSLLFEKKKSIVSLKFTCKESCQRCKNKLILNTSFLVTPPWVFIQTNKNAIYANELPKILVFGNKSYQFLCATIYSNEHFRFIFYLNSRFFLFDDLSQSIVQKIPKLKVVTCFYFLKN